MNREELVNRMKEFTEDEYAEPFYNAKQCADIAEQYAKEKVAEALKEVQRMKNLKNVPNI